MFQKNDYIVYGTTGVCRVLDIGHPQGVRNIDSSRLYYTLEPVYQPGSIYTPVDTTIFMRPILTSQEAEALILQIPSISESDCGCAGRDQKLLSSHYHSFLESHRCEDLVQLIKTVYSKNRRNQQGGRKPSSLDQLYLRRAEGLLYGEFAVALGIDPGEVVSYIRDRIHSSEGRKEAAS